MTPSPDPRWWRRRRDLALADARQAQGTAAVALLELDTAQRSAAGQLDVLTALDAGAVGTRLRTAWRPVSEAADQAVADYLEATSRWDVETDLEVEDATAAAAAFRGHAETMTAAVRGIAAFSERTEADVAAVRRTLHQVRQQRAGAEQAVSDAVATIEQVEAEGLHARRARHLLEQAREHLHALAAAPSVGGLAAAEADSRKALAAAAEAIAAARELPGQREHVQLRISALRTRVQAVAFRAEAGVEPILRTLRREYVSGCSRDLEDVPARVAEALANAREEVAAAEHEALPTQQKWEKALAALGRARDALNDADEHLNAPRDRLGQLTAISTDPEAAWSAARFVVRDAQKLLMTGPVDSRMVTHLDALAERLDAARELLDRPHPDWLAYARHLDGVVDTARGLIVDIRASRAISS